MYKIASYANLQLSQITIMSFVKQAPKDYWIIYTFHYGKGVHDKETRCISNDVCNLLLLVALSCGAGLFPEVVKQAFSFIAKNNILSIFSRPLDLN